MTIGVLYYAPRSLYWRVGLAARRLRAPTRVPLSMPRPGSPYIDSAFPVCSHSGMGSVL